MINTIILKKNKNSKSLYLYYNKINKIGYINFYKNIFIIYINIFLYNIKNGVNIKNKLSYYIYRYIKNLFI